MMMMVPAKVLILVVVVIVAVTIRWLMSVTVVPIMEGDCGFHNSVVMTMVMVRVVLV